MDQHEQPARGNDVESAADRRLANIVLLLLLALLVGGGIWLTSAMLDQRTLDDCLAQGRRNCAPIDVPAR